MNYTLLRIGRITSDRSIACFLSLLIFTPFLTIGQKVSNTELATKLIDLSDKTFVMREAEEAKKTENDLGLYLIFHKNGKATFRVKRGDTIMRDNLLIWRLVGDSLFIQNNLIEIIAEGKIQTINREPTKYVVEKAQNGYLFKEGNSQTFWFELK